MKKNASVCIGTLGILVILMVSVIVGKLFLDRPDQLQCHSDADLLAALKSLPVSEYEDFMAKAKAYDYCGLDAKGEQFPVRDIGSREKAGRIGDALYFQMLVRFQSALEGMERASVGNDRLTFTNALNRVHGLLAEQRDGCIDPKVRFPSGIFVRCLEKTEYALLRCLERRGECVRPNACDVAYALPDVFFDNSFGKCSWMSGTSPRLFALKTFRDMIAMSCRILRYDTENGRLPHGLDDVMGDGLVGGMGDFLYSCRGRSWQLFFPKSPKAAMLPFNVYVPSIFRNTEGWPVPMGLWISSDFSMKRRVLYRTGHLNESFPEWECVFVDGKIRKPRYANQCDGFMNRSNVADR